MRWKSAGPIAALLVAAAVPLPANAGPVVLLSEGTFTGRAGMTCTGVPSMTCSHTWDGALCFEAAGGSSVGSLGCDVNGSGKSRGTAARTPTGDVVCTTTSATTSLSATVIVASVFFGSTDVPVVVAQTNGVGTFRGSRTLLDKTVNVEGSFSAPGYDPQYCGTSITGTLAGTFTVTVP